MSRPDMSSHSNQELCVSCENIGIHEKAAKFCRNCVESFCQKCSKICHSVEALKHHEFVDIDDRLENVREMHLLRKMSRLVQCPSHPTKKIRFHCLDHDRFCCSTCAFVEHRTCSKVVEIAKIAGNVNEIEDIRQQVSKTSNDAIDAIAKLNDCAEETKTQEISVSECIRKMRGKIDKILNDFESKCNETTKVLATKETQRIYREIQRIQSEIKPLKEYAPLLDKAEAFGSTCHQYIAKRKCLDIVKVIEPSLHDLKRNFKSIGISFEEGELLKDLLNLCPDETIKLGRIREVKNEKPLLSIQNTNVN